MTAERGINASMSSGGGHVTRSPVPDVVQYPHRPLPIFRKPDNTITMSTFAHSGPQYLLHNFTPSEWQDEG